MAEEKNEKIYTIPLVESKKKCKNKRTPYAVKIVKNYLIKHTKAKEIKLGKQLNEEIWKRGIRKPPRRVRVKAIKDGDVVKAELIGFEYEEFKAKPKSEKKGMKEKLMARLGPKALKKEEEEKAIEGKKGKDEKKEEGKEKKEAKEETKEVEKS
jgi:large subunit ribosomal protein L31e